MCFSTVRILGIKCEPNLSKFKSLWLKEDEMKLKVYGIVYEVQINVRQKIADVSKTCNLASLVTHLIPNSSWTMSSLIYTQTTYVYAGLHRGGSPPRQLRIENTNL